MKVIPEFYPFSPLSGQVIAETADGRVERYWENRNFSGKYFEITYTVVNDKDMSFSISDVKP